MEAMTLLVDSHHGIYAWDHLAENFYNNLVVEQMGRYITFDSWVNFAEDGETADTIFNPDNEHWCDNVEWFEGAGYIRNDEDKLLYSVVQIEGDIWAIHPEAEWDDESDTYVIKGEVNA